MTRNAALIAAAAGLLAAGAAFAQERVRRGQTEQEVLDMLGPPTGKAEMGGTLILMYPEGSITLEGGVVTDLPKKKIFARGGAKGGGGAKAGPRPGAPAWPPAIPQPSGPSELAAAIPGYAFIESQIAAAAARNKIAHTPEAIRREAVGVWYALTSGGRNGPMEFYLGEAKAYRDKHAEKEKFDYSDQKALAAQARCGSAGSWQYLPGLPPGGSSAACWLKGKQRAFAKMYTQGAYDYGQEYDQSVWLRQHWDNANGRWDVLGPGQAGAFQAEFSGTLQQRIAALKAASAKPVDASAAASIGDLVKLYENHLRGAAFQKFLEAFWSLPVPAP